MPAYYNEIDPYAAEWLRNLIVARHIAPGDVDERSIADVRPDDLRSYTQCHFFAGIGGWSVALRLANWPDDRPVWTGSCPCQPFSAAGSGKAADDERHLWPAWFSLIRECKPAIVFGEQVEAAIGWGWLDLVLADLEDQGYACGASVLPACSVGAPHIRNRLWFVADANGRNAGTEGLQRSGQQRMRAARRSRADGLANPAIEGWRTRPQRPAGTDGRTEAQPRRLRDAGELGDANSAGLSQRERDGRFQREALEPSPRQAAVSGSDAWHCDWLPCTDGKARPVRPGSFPLAHGVQRRPSKLRAYGNAIVPQVAAEFIKSIESA